jgi:hypothetical protein
MEPEGSLPCSQEPSTSPYPEPVSVEYSIKFHENSLRRSEVLYAHSKTIVKNCHSFK